MRHIQLFEKYDFKWTQLKKILLNIGGTKVIKRYEEDIDLLLEKGEIINFADIDIVKMDPSQCHRNSATYYEYYIDNNGDAEPFICTGWALLEGDWIQHSWILLDYGEYELIETTKLRDEYFGIILDKHQTLDFLENNI